MPPRADLGILSTRLRSLPPPRVGGVRCPPRFDRFIVQLWQLVVFDSMQAF